MRKISKIISPIAIIFIILIISLQNFDNNKNIKNMLICKQKGELTTKCSKEINDMKQIEKFEKVFDEINGSDDIAYTEDKPYIVLKIYDKKNIYYSFEVWDKDENAVITVNDKGKFEKFKIDEIKTKQILQEIENIKY